MDDYFKEGEEKSRALDHAPKSSGTVAPPPKAGAPPPPRAASTEPPKDIIQYGAPMSICHACHLASPLGPVKQWHVD
ncbi:Leucine aminopeptidase 2 [Verticillium dahliae VDG2]|nr:Leucine aminopeptidase 2 [Verticillium dahliae VDG2]